MKINTKKISFRLVIGVLLFVIIGVTVLSSVSIGRSRTLLTRQAEDRLMSEARSAAAIIDGYFHERLENVRLVASDAVMINPASTEEEIEERLESYQQAFGDTFIDLIMISPAMEPIASSSGTTRDSYEGINWLEQGLTSGYAEWRMSIDHGYHLLVISQPVISRTGQVLGTIGGRMPFSMVDEVLFGIQETFEQQGWSGSYPYIVSDEGVVVWHPVAEYAGELNMLEQGEALAETAERMIRGETGTAVYSHEGEERMIGFNPMTGSGDFQGFGWSMAVTMDTDLFEAPLQEVTYLIIGASIALLVLLTLFMIFFIQRGFKPLVETTRFLREISEGEGDLTKRIPVKRQDEAGEMATYFNDFIGKIQKMVGQLRDQSDELAGSAHSLQAIASDMVAGSQETSDKTSTVSSATEQINASISHTAEAAAETSTRLQSIVSAVEEVGASVRNLASASEETSAEVNQSTSLMENVGEETKEVQSSTAQVNESVNQVAVSIRQINGALQNINDQCEKSMDISKKAGQQAETTSQAIEKLNESSGQVTKIVEVIRDIADQTNMLALNAAIEAAGAGEAGKGFAVVANEVKELARQTSEATEEIQTRISGMETEMKGSVDAVQAIQKVIGEMQTITNTIADAVTEESNTTAEISENMVGAAEQVNNISKRIETMSDNITQTLRSSSEAAKGVGEVARSITEISKAVDEMTDSSEAAAQEMKDVTRSTEEIRAGSDDIAQNVEEINQTAAKAAKGASSTSQAADALSEMAQSIQQLLSQFKS